MKIRHRLALLYSSGMTGFMILFGGIVLFFFQESLREEFDRTLVERLAYLQRHLEVRADGSVYFRGTDANDVVTIKGVAAIPYVEVWHQNAMVFRSGDVVLPDTLEGVVSFRAGGRLMRAMSGLAGGGAYLIVAAFDESRLHQRVRTLLVIMAVTAPLGILVIGVLSLYFASRALRPVHSITHQASMIDAGDLAARVDEVPTADEIGDLSRVLNSLLDRIEGSFDSLRQFTSDASHEIRTPLSVIRSSCEVALQKGPRQDSEVLETILSEVERMTELLAVLLMLARGDAGAIAAKTNPVSGWTIAEEVRDLLSVLADERKQRIEMTGTDVTLTADSTLLRQAVMCVLHNAILYAPEHSVISIDIAATPTNAEISILDSGPGIEAEHANSVFDRFYRVDGSRTRNQGGAGLGLSVARWIMTLHDGEIDYRDRPEGGSIFRLRLPLTASP
ncbi:MAG: ATP-binding protein [Pseudomonadota bacterium]